jgi:uncharacterized protein YjiS (DUF1127 family)
MLNGLAAQDAVASPRAGIMLGDIGRSVLAGIRAVVNRYSAGQQLAAFDERMLRDIGLTPGDVSSAFSEPLWRDPTIRLSVLAVERRAAARTRHRVPRLIAKARSSAEPEVIAE